LAINYLDLLLGFRLLSETQTPLNHLFMKKLLLIASCFAGFSAHSFAQVINPSEPDLELISTSSGTSIATVVAGSNFSLNIDIMGSALVVTPALDSFNITLSGSPTSITALPTGIALTLTNAFTNEPAGFFGGQGGASNLNFYGAASLSPFNDVPFTLTPTTILTANFTTSASLAPGTYTIDFPPVGDFQNLFYTTGGSNPTSVAIPYNSIDATIVVLAAPEPAAPALLLMGLAMFAGFGFLKRFQLAR
jgi:hypothetical protein